MRNSFGFDMMDSKKIILSTKDTPVRSNPTTGRWWIVQTQPTNPVVRNIESHHRQMVDCSSSTYFATEISFVGNVMRSAKLLEVCLVGKLNIDRKNQDV